MIGDAPRARAPSVVEVGPASADDLDAVMDIMGPAFSSGFGEAWTRSQCAGILPMSGVALRLARDAQGRPAGFSLMRAIAGEAELLLLAVAPVNQRKGVGRALVEDFIRVATSGGASRLHLEVRDGNPAIGLYLRAGFTIVGRRRGYYHAANGLRVDALTLALDDDKV